MSHAFLAWRVQRIRTVHIIGPWEDFSFDPENILDGFGEEFVVEIVSQLNAENDGYMYRYFRYLWKGSLDS